MTLDRLMYPHLFALILYSSDYATLCKLGATSRAVQAQVKDVIKRRLRHLKAAPTLQGLSFEPVVGHDLLLPTDVLSWPIAKRPSERTLLELLQHARTVDIDLRRSYPTNGLLDRLYRATNLRLLRLRFSAHWSALKSFNRFPAGYLDVVASDIPGKFAINAHMRHYTLLFHNSIIEADTYDLEWYGGPIPNALVIAWTEPDDIAHAFCDSSKHTKTPYSKCRSSTRVDGISAVTVAIIADHGNPLTLERLRRTYKDMCNHAFRSLDAFCTGGEMPPMRDFDGVQVVSLDAYKAMRGDRYELEGFI